MVTIMFPDRKALPLQIWTVVSAKYPLLRREATCAVLVLISLIAWSLRAQAAEVMVHSSEALMGRDLQEDVDFAAVVREGQVVLVEIHLPEKQFIARIDYAHKTLDIKSLTPEQDAAVPITPD